MTLPISILDLAHIGEDGIAASLHASVELAQAAEKWGYRNGYSLWSPARKTLRRAE